jgi:hypothetical protein
MLPSFLSYIVQQHGLTFEDVATDGLTHILQNSPSARLALQQALNQRVAGVLPTYFSVETRFDTQGSGIPDIVLKDETGCPCVIIEAKFSAGLTQYQPEGYLDYLEAECQEDRSAILVFLIPESKEAHYSREVRERCKERAVCWGTSASTALRLFIHLMTWTELFRILRAAEANLGDLNLFLQDLERMCELAEPDKYEAMTDAEVADDLRNVRRISSNRTIVLPSEQGTSWTLASEIAKRSFAGTQKVWAKYDNAWGATWSGIYGSIAEVDAWIGFDASAWSEHGLSPVWLMFEGKNKLPNLERRLISLGRDAGYFLRSNGNQLAIPISLGTGCRDEVLERCCHQVALVKTLLTSNSSVGVQKQMEPTGSC